MRRATKTILLLAALILSALALVGANPNQDERPPQPFFQDFLSGSVLLQASLPPEGTVLIACIDECASVYESSPFILTADGAYDQLEIAPEDEDLIGHTIYFYLVNEHGRIRAQEARPYIGVFDFYVQNLTFVDPLPTPGPTPTPEPTAIPTPTASLPVAGDPAVARVPQIALLAGAVAVAAGVGLLLIARRRIA